MSQAKQPDKEFAKVPVKGSWEIPRKSFHYSIGRKIFNTNENDIFTNPTLGFIVLYLYMNGTETNEVYPLLTVFLCIVSSAEFLRFNVDWFNRLYCSLLGPLMRPTEVKTRINGVVYYLLGTQEEHD